MKKVVFAGLSLFLLLGCGNRKQQDSVSVNKQAESISVDELYRQASTLVDKEVTVKGTVFHVCREGGARCFLMGSSDSITIRVEAGEGIGAFTQEQVGSELEITGLLKEVKTEAEAHNPAREHGDSANAVTEQAHQLIADAEEAQEVNYYIDGMKIK